MKAVTERKDEDALALELGSLSLSISRAPECCIGMAGDRRERYRYLRGCLCRAALEGCME